MRNGREDRHRDVPVEWLSLEETCRYLRVSEATLRRMLRKGHVPGAIKLGGLWRVHLDTLREGLLQTMKDL